MYSSMDATEDCEGVFWWEMVGEVPAEWVRLRKRLSRSLAPESSVARAGLKPRPAPPAPGM